MIGHFAPYGSAKVHVMLQGKPVCGTWLSRVAVFRWCGDARNRGSRASVDCKSCLRYLAKAKENRQWPFNEPQ